jgi:hypothetical protein
MARKYRFRMVFDRGYYGAIGRAIVTWAYLEIEIDEHLIPLLWHEKSNLIRKKTPINPGELLPNSLSARIKIWKKLAPLYYEGDVLKQARAIIANCARLKPKRDKLAHAEWVIAYSGKYDGALVAYRHRHGARYDDEPLTVADIRQTTHEMGSIIADIHAFRLNHHPDGPISKRLRRLFQSLRQDSKTRGHSPESNKWPSRPRSSQA